jgi:hypothetical protein
MVNGGSTIAFRTADFPTLACLERSRKGKSAVCFSKAWKISHTVFIGKKGERLGSP